MAEHPYLTHRKPLKGIGLSGVHLLLTRMKVNACGNTMAMRTTRQRAATGAGVDDKAWF
jgi:hypothetical protein